MDGSAAHRLRHADAAAHRQVTARAGTSRAAAHGLAGFNLDGGPQRQAGAEIGAGERDDGVGLELESAAHQRHFERRGVLRIAHQEVARAQRQGIGGAGRGDAEVRVAEAAEVLDGGLEAGGEDADIRAANVRERGRSRGSAEGTFRDEADAVAHAQQRRRRSLGIEQAERRASDDAPAAGRGQRVDAGLAAADGHAAGGHLFPRRGKARRGKLGWKTAQVRKAGGEAHEIDQVIGRGVQLDHALGRQAGVARHVLQVGAEFTSVADRDLDHAGGAGFVNRGLHALARQSFDIRVAVKPRVEIDEDGRERGVQVQDGALALQGAGEARHLVVRVDRDFIAERNQQRAVARRLNGHPT